MWEIVKRKVQNFSLDDLFTLGSLSFLYVLSIFILISLFNPHHRTSIYIQDVAETNSNLCNVWQTVEWGPDIKIAKNLTKEEAINFINRPEIKNMIEICH